MLDNHFDRDGRSERERPLRPASDLGSMSDREVPLTPAGADVDLINRWLDGEAPEPTGLRGDAAKSVEFWRRIGEEAERRKRMVTPAHVPARIMASLPPLAPHGGVTPWYRRDVRLSTPVLVFGALGLVALGVIIARALV